MYFVPKHMHKQYVLIDVNKAYLSRTTTPLEENTHELIIKLNAVSSLEKKNIVANYGLCRYTLSNVGQFLGSLGRLLSVKPWVIRGREI